MNSRGGRSTQILYLSKSSNATVYKYCGIRKCHAFKLNIKNEHQNILKVPKLALVLMQIGIFQNNIDDKTQ